MSRSSAAVLSSDPMSMTALSLDRSALPSFGCVTLKGRATILTATAPFSSADPSQKKTKQNHPLSRSGSYKSEFRTHFCTEQQCNIYLTLHEQFGNCVSGLLDTLMERCSCVLSCPGLVNLYRKQQLVSLSEIKC